MFVETARRISRDEWRRNEWQFGSREQLARLVQHGRRRLSWWRRAEEVEKP
jgi:hypothetical protein